MFPFRVLSLASSLKMQRAAARESTKAQWRVITAEVTVNDERKLPIVSQIRFAMKENRRVERRGFVTGASFPIHTWCWVSRSEERHLYWTRSKSIFISTCRNRMISDSTLYRSVDMDTGGVVFSMTNSVKYTLVVLYRVSHMRYRDIPCKKNK